MRTFEHIVALTAPLFILVLLGYGMTRWAGWPKPVSDALTRFVFAVGIPALLFRPDERFFAPSAGRSAPPDRVFRQSLRCIRAGSVSRQFDTLGGPVAASLLMSTALA